MSVNSLQAEVREWADRNFGPTPSYLQLLGAMEELGEVARTYLKREQGIRQDEGMVLGEEVADVIIYLLDFAGKEGFSLQTELEKKWNEVRKRDWNEHRAVQSAGAADSDVGLRSCISCGCLYREGSGGADRCPNGDHRRVLVQNAGR